MLFGWKVAVFDLHNFVSKYRVLPIVWSCDPNVRLITAARCRSPVLACLLVYLLFTVHKQLAEYKFECSHLFLRSDFGMTFDKGFACFKGIFR